MYLVLSSKRSGSFSNLLKRSVSCWFGEICRKNKLSIIDSSVVNRLININNPSPLSLSRDMRKSLPDCQIWDSCERRVEGSLSHLAFSPTPYSYRFFTPHFIFSCHLITRLSARRWRVNRSADRPSAINSTIRPLFDASRLLCFNNNIINLNNCWK